VRSQDIAHLQPLSAFPEKAGQVQNFPVVVAIPRVRQTKALLLLWPGCAPRQSWADDMNFNLLYCYLSGQHDFGVRCEPGEIYLRCIHCGRRSAGWAVSATAQRAKAHAATTSAKRHAAPDKPAPKSASPAVASF
jgi:hypothetical protein